MILISDYFFYDLKASFPNDNIIAFPVRGNPQSFAMLMPVQANPSRYYTNSQANISIIIQGIDARSSLELATSIYDRYRDQVNLTLTVPTSYQVGILPRSIICKYISPVDRPVPLGDVDNGRFQYSLNFFVQLGGQE